MSDNSDEKNAEITFVMPGEKSIHDGVRSTGRKKFRKKSQLVPVEKLTKEILNGSRQALARGITLLESTTKTDETAAQQLLLNVLAKTGNSIRIGVTGVPGAGKSTFIEQFGLMLCEQNIKIAVLAIDPSSSISGGSILGDKTRMERLASHPNAFIRPSPASGTLGGVHKKTRETMLLCEAAGYEIILIETVGVGQSETAVRNMVDLFLLLALTGAGDDLQGMKKGIMELIDLIIVHKADGNNVRQAKRTVREYKRILHTLQPSTPDWMSVALPVSSLKNTGFEEVWNTILSFEKTVKENDFWQKRRKAQTISWLHSLIKNRLIDNFYAKDGIKEQIKVLEADLLSSKTTVSKAVDELFDGFL